MTEITQLTEHWTSCDLYGFVVARVGCYRLSLLPEFPAYMLQLWNGPDHGWSSDAIAARISQIPAFVFLTNGCCDCSEEEHCPVCFPSLDQAEFYRMVRALPDLASKAVGLPMVPADFVGPVLAGNPLCGCRPPGLECGDCHEAA